MSAENIKEVRRWYSSKWHGIAENLPEDLTSREKKFARGYFNAQLRIFLGQKKKAGRIFAGLDKDPDYYYFERNNPQLLAAIDLAVRGETRRIDVPLFTIKNAEDCDS